MTNQNNFKLGNISEMTQDVFVDFVRNARNSLKCFIGCPVLGCSNRGPISILGGQLNNRAHFQSSRLWAAATF